MATQTINKKATRNFILGYAKKNKRGWKCKRVSDLTLEQINAVIISKLQHAVEVHPVEKVTFKELALSINGTIDKDIIVINWASTKEFILRYAKANREDWDCRRVSKKIFYQLNTYLIDRLISCVQNHPTIGVTFTEFN